MTNSRQEQDAALLRVKDLEKELEDLKLNLSKLQINDTTSTLEIDHPPTSSETIRVAPVATTSPLEIPQSNDGVISTLSEETRDEYYNHPSLNSSHLCNLKWAHGCILLIKSDLSSSATIPHPKHSVEVADRLQRESLRAKQKLVHIMGAMESTLWTLITLSEIGEFLEKLDGGDVDGEKSLLWMCDHCSKATLECVVKAMNSMTTGEESYYMGV